MLLAVATSASYVAAFFGGLVSFLSPCVLPLVPAYLSLVTGLDVAEMKEGGHHHSARIVRDTGLFVLGFTVVFVLLGLSATTVGTTLLRNQHTITRVSGGLVIAMAAVMAGSLFLNAPRLYGERRFHVSPARLGPFAAPVAGAAFGFGWTPCIGPALTAVLAVAAASGRTSQGAGLLAVYSLGLGLPFLASGLALGRLTNAFGWVKRHFRAVTLASSAALAGFGVLLLLDKMTWVTVQLQRGVDAVGLGFLIRLG